MCFLFSLWLCMWCSRVVPSLLHFALLSSFLSLFLSLPVVFVWLVVLFYFALRQGLAFIAQVVSELGILFRDCSCDTIWFSVRTPVSYVTVVLFWLIFLQHAWDRIKHRDCFLLEMLFWLGLRHLPKLLESAMLLFLAEICGQGVLVSWFWQILGNKLKYVYTRHYLLAAKFHIFCLWKLKFG